MRVFYDEQNNCIQDIIDTDDRGLYSKEHYKDYLIMPLDDAIERMESAAKSAPVRITFEQWNYALEALPPLAWINTGHTESFQMSERIMGEIATIYVRIGKEYFELCDNFKTTHSQAVEMCKGV